MIDFPSSDDIKSGIETYTNTIFPEYSNSVGLDLYIKSLEDFFFNKFKIIPPILIQPDSYRELDFKLFRARPLDEIRNIEMFSEYSYPPSHLCSKQRLNYPGFPLFYSSNNPLIALLETVKNNYLDNPERLYCLSKWEIEKKNDINISPFVFHNTELDNPFAEIGEHILTNLAETFEYKLSESQLEAIRILMKFLGTQFTLDNNYSFSAYFGFKHFYSQNIPIRSDLMIYPSIVSDLRAVNFAVHPNVIDNCSVLKNIYIIKVSNYDKENDILSITLHHKMGIVINSKIDWIEINPDNEIYLQSIKEDFGEFYNSNFIKINNP